MAEPRRVRKRDADLYIGRSFRASLRDAFAHGPGPVGPAGLATVAARLLGGVRTTVWRAGPGAGALAATLHALCCQYVLCGALLLHGSMQDAYQLVCLVVGSPIEIHS